MMHRPDFAALNPRYTCLISPPGRIKSRMSMCALEVLVRSACAVAFPLAALGTGTAQPIGPQLTPLVADVMWAPHAFPGSARRTHLVYEIRIANVTAGRMTLKRVAAL